MKALLLAALLALPALPQAQLYVWDPQARVEHPVRGLLYDVGAYEVWTRVDTVFRLRNPGPASVKLGFVDQSPNEPPFRINGVSFSLITSLKGSWIMAPGAMAEFTIRFQPQVPNSHSTPLEYATATGTQAPATTTLTLMGKGVAGPIVLIGEAELAPESNVDFGTAETGTSTSRRFTVKNTTGGPQNITIAVSGADFRSSSASMMLNANASAEFDVFWEPKTAGPSSGTLLVDAIPFLLTGAATAPPLPRPQIVLDPPAPGCAQQVHVGVRFDEASRAAGSGKLEISSTREDPGLRFLTPATFTLQKGDTAARFGTAASVDLQTGTTEGTVTITATLGAYTETASFQLAPTAVVADSAIGLRSAASVNLTINAYDNTRTAGPLAFTFRDRSGSVLGFGAIFVDASASFADYFQKAKAGGLFTLRASFPVSGAISTIDSVDVSIGNSMGTLQRNVKIAE